MTTTLPTQPVEVERITYAEAFDTIAALIADGAPHPQGFAVQGYGEDPRLAGAAILTLRFDSRAALDRWACLLDFPAAESRGHHTDGHYEYTIHEAHRRWNGWSMWLRAWVHVPVPVMFDEDCATCRAFRLDGPAELPSSTCRDCGGEMTHRAGCPSEPEHLADHYAADPPMLCTRCGEPFVPGEPSEQRTAGRVHPNCELAVNPPECVDCCGLGGSHQEFCAFASRVNPEAAAKLPVLVLDVTRDATETLSVGSPCGRCSQPIGPDDLIEAHPTADWFVHVECAPVAYTPVHYPTGVEVNRAECARLDAETQDAVLTDEQRHCHTIDVVTVDPELVDDGRGDPGMAHLMAAPAVRIAPDEPTIEIPLPQQTSFAEAAERLAHAMLEEASGE